MLKLILALIALPLFSGISLADQDRHGPSAHFDGVASGAPSPVANPDPFEHPRVFNRKLRPLITAIDYHTRMIYIFNYRFLEGAAPLAPFPVAALDPTNGDGLGCDGAADDI